jgi:hypothetical protein
MTSIHNRWPCGQTDSGSTQQPSVASQPYSPCHELLEIGRRSSSRSRGPLPVCVWLVDDPAAGPGEPLTTHRGIVPQHRSDDCALSYWSVTVHGLASSPLLMSVASRSSTDLLFTPQPVVSRQQTVSPARASINGSKVTGCVEEDRSRHMLDAATSVALGRRGLAAGRPDRTPTGGLHDNPHYRDVPGQVVVCPAARSRSGSHPAGS